MYSKNMKLLIFLISLSQFLLIASFDERPLVNIRIANIQQTKPNNIRHKRSIKGLRIYRHYDSSFNALKNKEELKMKVIDPAIRFWEEALQVKIPFESPIFIVRSCDGPFVERNEINTKIRICYENCSKIHQCFTTTIPEQFFTKCYVSTGYGEYKALGTNPTGAPNSDLIILITHKKDGCNGNTLAYATACEIEETLNRPILGLINLCPGGVTTGLKLQTAIDTLRHEIVHLLGFSPVLFAFFRDDVGNPLTPRDRNDVPNLGEVKIGDILLYQYSNITIRKKTYPVTYRTGTENKTVHLLVTPNVQREVRNYFNCASLDGLTLEDNGTPANSLSHFEKRIFQEELMTSNIASRGVASRFTMAFLKDTGWYLPDYNKSEKFEFAKGSGCEFVTQTCFEYMQNRMSRNESVYPYCNEVIAKHSVKCSKKLRNVVVCDLHNIPSSDIPLKFRHFNNTDYISSDLFSDFCPYVTGIIRMGKTDSIYNGVCMDLQNNLVKGTKYDFFNEGFGPDSACIMFDKIDPWYYKSCNTKSSVDFSGSGCYNYRCSSEHRLVIRVNGFDYQCRTDGQIIDVTSRNTYLIPYGRLLCPQCSMLCNNTVCQSQPKSLPVKCNNVNRPCHNQPLYGIPCSSSVTRMKLLYLCTFILIIFIFY